MRGDDILYEICELREAFSHVEKSGENIDKLGERLKDIYSKISSPLAEDCDDCRSIMQVGRIYNEMTKPFNIYFRSTGVPVRIPVKKCPFDD